MLKFLRRYNKWILAVFGTLLMIVFLIPQALDTLARTAGARAATRATIGGGEEVSITEFEQAQNELLALDRSGFRRQVFPWVEAPEHWFLLTREARDAGLIGPNQILALSPQDLEALAATGTNPRALGQTAASRDGVLRLLGLYRGAAQPSDRRLRAFAKRLLHAVKAEVVVLEASADDASAEPTPDEIRQQFDTYRDVNPGEGDMGFGYRLPDRFKLEWLTIDEAAVRSSIEAGGGITAVELFKHWQRSEGQPGIPPYVAGQPAPESVRENLLNRKIQDKLDEIAKFAWDQLRARRRGLPEADGFIVLPDNWDELTLTFPDLAEEIRERFAVTLPAYESIGDRWLALDDLADLGPLSSASTDKFGAQPIGLRQLIPAAREFGGDGAMPVQQKVALPPLRSSFDGQDGSIYIARLTDTDPSRPPRNVDEVRDVVVRDLKRRSAFQRLAESIPSLEAKAREQGLLAFALDHETALQTAPEITLCSSQLLDLLQRQGLAPQALPSSLPTVGADVPTIEAIIDRALQLPMGPDLSSVPESQRTFAVPVENALAVIVVRVLEQIPLTEERYKTLAGNGTLQGLLIESEVDAEDAENTFSYDTMAARHDFKMQQPETQDGEAPDDLDAPADGTTAANTAGSP